MDDSTKLEYEAWRRATVAPAHVESKNRAPQRMLGAPFEAFVKAAWLAGLASPRQPDLISWSRSARGE